MKSKLTLRVGDSLIKEAKILARKKVLRYRNYSANIF